MIMPSKKQLEITLTGSDSHTYLTNDLIRGHMCLDFDKDTKIGAPSITFEGKASTRVEKHPFLSNKAGDACGYHTFLRLTHSVRPSDIPENGVALQSQTYRIPFEFRVPETLLPYACSHATASGNAARRQHLLPPPSLGECFGNSPFVDLSRKTDAKVNYAIHVKVRRYFSDGWSMVLKKSKTVCVMPIRLEGPPIPITIDDPYYQLVQEKDIFRGIGGLGATTGRLIARTTSLPTLKLQHPRRIPDDDSALQAAVQLCFTPATREGRPPRLDSIILELHSHTFYGAVPYQDIPRPGDTQSACADRTNYMDTTRLGNYCLRDMGWSAQPAEQSPVRGDAIRHCPRLQEAASSQQATLPVVDDDPITSYNLSLQVPIRLPQDPSNSTNRNAITPSFNCCLISRMYSVEIKIGYKTDRSEVHESGEAFFSPRSVARLLTPATHLTLRVPLQVQIVSGRSPSLGTSVPQDHATIPETLLVDDDCFSTSHVEQLPTYTPEP